MRRLAGPGTALYASVKADGYGFGLPGVAGAMLAAGADGFSLADPGDAVRIRQAGIGARILLYGGVLPDAAAARFLAEHDVICTIADVESARAWAALGDAPVRAFLKLDVGLERLGAPAEDARAFAEAVAALPGVRIEGVYTHLHGGETPGYREWQLDRFDRALEQLERAGIEPSVRLAESSVTLGGPAGPRLNAVDPGHLLYGFLPPGRPVAADDASNRLLRSRSGLRPALVSLKTRIVHVKAVSRPGFAEAAPVPLREGLRIAVVPLGRADGLRSLHCGEALVRGRRVPLVGPLSLEHARLDVTGVPDCAVGDEVVLIGRQGDEEIPAASVAAYHGLDGVGLAIEARPTIARVHLEAGRE